MSDFNASLRQHRAQKIANALLKGMELVRPACECLSTKLTMMHHIDYDRPWLVAFLCPKCHSHEHHGMLKRAYRLHDLRKPIVP